MKKPKALLTVIAVLAGFLGIYLFQGETRKAESPAGTKTASNSSGDNSGFSKALAAGPLAAFLIHSQRKDVGQFAFADAAGVPLSLDGWKGRVVLLNLWATWCAPCRKEMPDLARLQNDMGGADFEVLALSLDRKGAVASEAFLKEIGAGNLKTYVDPEGKSLAILQALGLPATLLIDRNGKEAGRLLGPANWASDEAKAMIQALVAEKP